MGLSVLATLIYGVEFGSGRLEKSFHRICKANLKEDEKEEKCDEVAEARAISTLIGTPLWILFEVSLSQESKWLCVLVC